MGLKSVFPLLFLIAAVHANCRYGREDHRKPNATREIRSTEKDTILCIPCRIVAKVLSMYVSSATMTINAVCSVLQLGPSCDGAMKMFFGAATVGGTRHACSLVKFCVRAVSKFGDSIKKTADGVGGLITGGADIFGQLASNIPIFGGPLQSLIGNTGKKVGTLSGKIGSGLGSLVDGSFWDQTGRKKRSAGGMIEEEAKAYLDSLDFELPPGASEMDKAFKELSEQIKAKTLKALRRLEEQLPESEAKNV
ncbi:unnamed protein product [Nippostrongylus brasiliensis]|uniref:Secreted protein n=1 Tax=Nippostrongylus brasiliensis TaxID=27835 RepID=A0A0N4XZZ2_NIPBR|nr:unnamed protein product [Nippostrongylus brasiliensis]